MTFEIEKGVPAPGSDGFPNRSKYPFGKMDAGESIVVKGDEKTLRRASEAATMYGRRNGKIFTCRTIEKGTMRIWRVE